MTIQSCSKTTAEAWAARQEMITETVAQFLYRAFPSDQARRRRSCKLVLRWLLDHRAETMDVELSAARIAAEITEQELEQRTGCSERTVQRVVSFLADVGVLRVWRRYNEDGGSLPPGGRLNWGAVLKWLGRESQGAALATCPERGRREAWSHSSAAVISARLAAPPSPVPAADFQAVSPRVEGTPVTPSTTPGVTRRNSCQPQGLTRESVSPGGGDTAGPCHPGAQAPVSPPPAAPPAAPPAGAGTRDAARILAAVRGWQAVCAEETALTDDAGQRRTVRWDQVRRAADEAAHVGRKGLDYAPLLAGRPLAALAWLSLAVFSPRWLTDSCSALNGKIRRDKREVRDPLRYLLAIARDNLVAIERLPAFESVDQARSYLASLTAAIDPWVAERLASEAASQSQARAASGRPSGREPGRVEGIPARSDPLSNAEMEAYHGRLANTEFGREFLRRRAALEKHESSH